MNQTLLAQRSREFDLLLSTYEATNQNAVKLRRAIHPLLQRALNGQLYQPVAWQKVPGDFLFSETDLGQYVDLSDAFSKFKIEATGGPKPALQETRTRAGLDPLTGDQL